MKKHLNNSAKIMTAISVGMATTVVTSVIDENSTITNNKIVEYIKKEDLSIKEQLTLSLNSLEYASDNFAVSLDILPTKFSLSVVTWLIDKLSYLNLKGLATLGIDYDGELYVKIITDKTTSYLSLEQPNLMHLLISYNDGSKYMLDDIYFKKGNIPKDIIKKLGIS